MVNLEENLTNNSQTEESDVLGESKLTEKETFKSQKGMLDLHHAHPLTLNPCTQIVLGYVLLKFAQMVASPVISEIIAKDSLNIANLM